MNMSRKLAVLLLVATFLIAGCSFFSTHRDPITRFFELSEAAPGEKILEDYLPADKTTLFFALKPGDEFEKQMASVVNLPQEKNPIDLGIIEHYQKNLADFGLSYEEDIRALWDEGKGRVAYGVTKDQRESIYLAVSITNNDQYEKVYALLKKKSGYAENDYKGVRILFNDDDAFYAAKIGSLLTISNSMDNLRQMISVDKDGLGTLSLRESEDYRRAIAQIKDDYWLWLYLDSVSILNREVSGQIDDPGLANFIFYGNEQKVSKRAFYAVKRDDDQIYIRGIALQKDGAFEAAMPFDIYLDQELPAENLILYLEKANISDLIERANEAGLNSDVDYFKRLVSAFGLNYDEDIKGILSCNVALALYNTETVLPNFVFLADIGENKAGAQKLIEKLNWNFGSYAVSLSKQNLGGSKNEEILGDIVKLEDVSIPGNDQSLRRFSVDTKRFVQAVTGQVVFGDESFLPEQIQLYYGLDGDRLLIALYPDFENLYKRNVLTDDADYVKVSQVLDEKGGMNLVFDMGILMKNLKRINDFLKGLNSPTLINDGFAAYESFIGDSSLFKRLYIRGRDRWGTQNMEMMVTF